MSEALATWATPGETVYELHCSTHDYSVKKAIKAAVVSVDDKRIVLSNGARYGVIDGTAGNGGFSYLRDDRANKNRYFLLVGPDDPRAQA